MIDDLSGVASEMDVSGIETIGQFFPRCVDIFLHLSVQFVHEG